MAERLSEPCRTKIFTSVIPRWFSPALDDTFHPGSHRETFLGHANIITFAVTVTVLRLQRGLPQRAIITRTHYADAQQSFPRLCFAKTLYIFKTHARH